METAKADSVETAQVLDQNQIAIKANMDQVTAKIYLQRDIFPKLEQALNIVRIIIINRWF